MKEPAPLSGLDATALQTYGQATMGGLASGRADALWRRTLERRSVRSTVSRGLVFAAGFAAGALLMVGGLRLREQATPSTAAVLTAGANARYRLEAGVYRLESGTLRIAATTEPMTIETAQFSVAVLAAQVTVEASDGHSVLAVEHGEVGYRDATGEHRVKAGQRATVRSGLSLSSSGQGASQCEGQGRLVGTCLIESARGEGLAAETALYELGLRAHEAGAFEPALGYFRESLRRFPNGALAPEASIAVMLEARAVGDVEGARAEARAFLVRFEGEARAPEVASWLAKLR